MRKVYHLIFIMFFVCAFAFFSFSCANSSGGGRPRTEISDLSFNSLTYELSAKVNVNDGTKVTLTCNDTSETAVAAGGMISLIYSSPFAKAAKGGKNYEVVFSADGYSSSSRTLSYWPEVKFKLASNEEIYVYNGGTENLEIPEIMLLNYDASAVKEEWNFEVDGSIKSDWTLTDVKNYLADLDNDGKTVKACFSLTPDCSDGADLGKNGYISWTCKKDVLVKSAGIVNDFRSYELHLFASNEPDYSSGLETAGGDIAFQWQISDDGETFTDIAGETGKKLTFTESSIKNCIGKTLRAKITQTYEGNVQESIASTTCPVFYKVLRSELYYDGICKLGSKFDVSKVEGKIVDTFDSSHDISTFTIYKISEIDENNGYLVNSSGYFAFTCENLNFYDYTTAVFVIAQENLEESEIPSLSTDIASITVGMAEFVTISKNLEVSFDGGANYEEFPEGEFTASEGDLIYVRKKAFGTPNSEGYIRESEPVEITVKNENVGKKVSGYSLIEKVINSELTLTQSVKYGKVYVIPKTNIPDADSLICKYKWFIDGTALSDYAGEGFSLEDDVLVADKEKLGTDSYQIYCELDLYIDSDMNKIITLSDQTSIVKS